MNDNFIVIMSAHVDNEDKKNVLIETLKHFKQNKINVCLSTHSNHFLNELSEHVDFIFYDKNNEFLELSDYLKYSDKIPESQDFGRSNSVTKHSFGDVNTYIPNSPHSKSALTILRNGVILSHFQNYEWTVYLEYDMFPPKNGYKKFITDHIEKLKSLNKKCFYYKNTFNSFNFLWGGFFVLKTDDFVKNHKLTNELWYKNKKEWIKSWGVGFFESCVEFLIKKSFTEDEILIDVIKDNYQEFWGVNTYDELNIFKYETTYYNNNLLLDRNFFINLYPSIDGKIFLYYFNNLNKKILINKLLIFSNNKILHHSNNFIVDEYQWSILNINIDDIDNDDILELQCHVKCDDETYYYSQTFNISNIQNIHNNVMRINFN